MSAAAEEQEVLPARIISTPPPVVSSIFLTGRNDRVTQSRIHASAERRCEFLVFVDDFDIKRPRPRTWLRLCIPTSSRHRYACIYVFGRSSGGGGGGGGGSSEKDTM
ncbi:hypothetical protein ABEF95_017190 [Exophiala dermatitidis]